MTSFLSQHLTTCCLVENLSRSICFLPSLLVQLAVRWGVPQWPFPQLLHPTFKFRLIRLERAAQSVTFHQVSPDTLQLGGIPQHWPFTLSWGNTPLLWLIWSKCYLIKLWDSDSEQMDISPIGWSHPALEFVKKFTWPNFQVKEFYTLKTRKLRLFLPVIDSKNASLSVIWASFG